MTQKVIDIINNQIKEEFYSSYLYLALSGQLEAWNLKGAANWMLIQAKEEVDHAMGFFKFLVDRGVAVKLEAIAKPEVNPKNILEVFEAGLKHEKIITGLIAKIYETAQAEKDYALVSFIKWYIDEQVEEEANATEMIDKIKLVGADGPAVYLIDKDLAARTYIPSGPYAAAA
jgi:ferritin